MKCREKIIFAARALDISFGTCYGVASEHVFSFSIHKYNISMLLHFNDFVDLFSKLGLIFATCKRSYVFSQKNFFCFHFGKLVSY